MEEYVVKDHKKLRRGFTTGTCAAAAARAASILVLGLSETVDTVEIVTPKGTLLTLPIQLIEKSELGSNSVRCAVKKDSGDDPDVTDGVMVYARVTLTADEQGTVIIDGGLGVGRVTKPGLACAVGQAAINPTPRKMIEAEVRRTAAEAGYEGGFTVEISIPDGVELAKRTYNPRLGIEGGISVLGTSGIVEPMSEQALIDTIKVEMNIRKAAGAEYLLITPGNYGETFLKETMNLGDIYTVKCSNFLGEALDYAVELGFKGVLLVAHIGKLVKVAGGIMNTHSRYGDARLEIMAAHGAKLGADRETIVALFSCVTTDEAIAVLDRCSTKPEPCSTKSDQCDAGPGTDGYNAGLERSDIELVHSGLTAMSAMRKETTESILEKIDFHIKERTRRCMMSGAVMFSNQYGYLGQTADAASLIEQMRK